MAHHPETGEEMKSIGGGGYYLDYRKIRCEWGAEKSKKERREESRPERSDDIASQKKKNSINSGEF